MFATPSRVTDLSAVAEMRRSYVTRERADTIIARAIPELPAILDEARDIQRATGHANFRHAGYFFRVEQRRHNTLILCSVVAGGAPLSSITI